MSGGAISDPLAQGRTRCFIGDLHLTDGPGPEVAAFVDWLGDLPLEVDLWILGDLFEYWLGPAHLESPGFAPVIEALAQRTEAGGYCALVPGNRDFLLDRAFSAATGVVLFHGGVRLGSALGDWFVLHGDELCTEDRGYQRLRSVLRSKPTRLLVRALPAFCKRRLAERLRRASKAAVPKKDPARIAMQTSAAQAALVAHGAQHLVCGHAHAFQRQELASGGTWWVLDAFGHGSHDVLRLGADGAVFWHNP